MTRSKKNVKRSEAPMPSLIFHEGTLGEPHDDQKPNTPVQFPSVNSKGYDAGARKMMWFGVTTVLIAIIGLWVWSLRVQYGSITWSKTAEGKIVDITRDSWEKAFHTDSPVPVTTEQIKNDIKQNLAKLIESVSSSSTMANATSTNAATTTN